VIPLRNRKLLSFFAGSVLFLLASSSAYACSFQMVQQTTVDVTVDGVTTTFVHEYWAWVGCDETAGGNAGDGGGIGPIYDPWPSDGFIGPPAPPPPPAPISGPCDTCQDLCWGEYAVCVSSENNTNWFGYCGVLCRETCRASRDTCVGNCVTDKC
jgi:hypothetical protein